MDDEQARIADGFKFNVVDQTSPPEPSTDLDLHAIGIGFGVAFLAGCITALIGIIALGFSNVDYAHIADTGVPWEVQCLGFVLGIVSHFLAGYFAARESEVNPKLNVVILALTIMVFGAMGVALNPALGKIPGPIVGWLITIPVMLFGASRAER